MPRNHPHRTTVALAACAFALPADAIAQDGMAEIQLTPAGDFAPSDGRELPVTHWHIDAAVAARVIARFAARANPPVIDYEHQTLLAEDNGQPAPAAGWIRELTWRDGQGLFAQAELTQRARDYIAAGEYRYVSPVFLYDPTDGDVLAIEMAAITNHPAIDGMQPLELRAAATFGCSQNEETSMNKLLIAICTALKLDPKATSEDDAISGLSAAFAADPLAPVRHALGMPTDAKAVDVVAACKAKTAPAKPNPAEFVAVATFETVKSELAALSSKLIERDVIDMVELGLSEGRLLSQQKDWAMELGRKDLAALTQYLEATAPIAALTTSQTGGKAPEKDDGTQLDDTELAVCTATGIDPKDFAAAKAA